MSGRTRPPERRATARLAGIALIACCALSAGGCLAPAGGGNPDMGGVRGVVTAKPRAGTEAIFAPPPPSSSGKHKGKGGDPYDPYAAPAPAEPKGKKAPYAPPPPSYPRVEYGSLQDIVVWIEPARGARRPTREEAEDPGARLTTRAISEVEALEVEDTKKPQKGARAIAVGSTIKITSFADQPLTFFSVTEGNEFDTGPLRPGESYEWRPRASGIVDLLCDERAEWKHAVAVVPTLRHAQVSSGRLFDFNDLPAGTYRLVAWHWRFPMIETIVDVRPGAWTRIELTISVDALTPGGPGAAAGPGPGPR